MPRKNKYIPVSNEKIGPKSYESLLEIETNEEYIFREEYIKSTAPIKCEHLSCGKIWDVAPYEILKRGSRCPDCSTKVRGDSQRSNTDDMKKLLFDHYGYNPYVFIGEYTGISNPIDIECTICNTPNKVTPGNMKNNMRLNRKPLCKACNTKRMKSNKMSDDEYEIKLMQLFGRKEYELLEEYKGTKTTIMHRCLTCNDSFSAKPQNILYAKTSQDRKYCPTCNNLKRDTRPYEDRLHESNPNIIALEGFINNRTEIDHQCLVCNHVWKSSPDNRLYGQGCPKCANIIGESKGETELIALITSHYDGEVIVKNRKILKGKELDVYLPEINIAFEYNGLYWHSEKHKGKNYHLNKTLECKEQNIQLYHVFEDEWINKREIVEQKILHLLGINDTEVAYARKCYIEEIDSSTKDEFLEANHIQGKDISRIKLGLWYPKPYGDELVAVMTFSLMRHSLGQKNSSGLNFELSRFATDIDYRVVGGFGKLLSYFTKNYTFKRMITYADLRWSHGNVYTKNNFKFIHNSKPNYWYVDRNNGTRRLHRYSFRKQVLSTRFPEVFNEQLTEHQIMDMTDFYRIWDCGNMVFEYNQ